MRRVQVMRRAARRPLTRAGTVEAATTAAPQSSLRRRRAARDAEVTSTLGRIDDVVGG
jgi:hypothetical protein